MSNNLISDRYDALKAYLEVFGILLTDYVEEIDSLTRNRTISLEFKLSDEVLFNSNCAFEALGNIGKAIAEVFADPTIARGALLEYD